MNKRYILTAKFVDREGKNQTDEQFFSGTAEEAREAAQRLHALLTGRGCRHVRVELWEVIATSYKGTIRGERT